MWKSNLDTILKTVHATSQLLKTKLNIILIHNYPYLNRIILRDIPLNFSMCFCFPYHYNVLRYKSEGRWFDPRWCHCNIFIDIKSFRSHYGPWFDSASNRNEYQEYFLGVKAAGA